MRTEIHWWIFPLIALLALFFPLIVVSMQSLRAARNNPAQALKVD